MVMRREEVASRPVAGGDFAVVNDLSALCILFPPAVEGGIYEAFFRIWIPEENLSRRRAEDKVPYEAWSKIPGIITVTPGSTTDFERIEHDLIELHKIVPFELGVDKSCIPDMFARLEKEIRITSVPQGFHLSAAIRRTEKLLAERRFCHFSHPVFCWAARNVQLRVGSIKGDCQLEKQKSRERIDPAVAAVLAVQMVLAKEQPQSTASASDPKKYEVKSVERK